MALTIFYDGADINKIVAIYDGSDTTAAWAGMTKLVGPIGSFAAGVDFRHHKIVTTTITEMTAGEKTARSLPAIVVPASDGWKTLQVQDVTNQATVDFTTAGHFDGTYPALKLIFLGVNGTTDDVQLLLRFKVSTWLAANYVHRSEAYRGTVAETTTSDATSAIVVIGTSTYKMGTGANEKFDGEITLGDPSTTDQDRSCIFDAWGEGPDTGHGCTIDGGGGVNDPGALEGLRLLASSGNLNGKFVLLGHKMA